MSGCRDTATDTTGGTEDKETLLVIRGGSGLPFFFVGKPQMA